MSIIINMKNLEHLGTYEFDINSLHIYKDKNTNGVELCILGNENSYTLELEFGHSIDMIEFLDLLKRSKKKLTYESI